MINRTPIDTLNMTDPGDETQRNFRYQHSYGVMILIAAIVEEIDKPYVALWCEQHEDFLAERSDGFFEAYQVKTAKPENGEWDTRKLAFKDSLRRFVNLEMQFPLKITSYYFVSNISYSNSEAPEKIGKSPIKLINSVQSCLDIKYIDEPFCSELKSLTEYCECTPDCMFNLLKKIKLIKGPDREGIDAVVAHQTIPRVPRCSGHTPAKLDSVRDELIQKVYKACSLSIEDPSQYWCGLNGMTNDHPRLLAKRISIQNIREYLDQQHVVPFRYLPASNSLQLGTVGNKFTVLEKKLIQAGLADQIDILQRRTLAAEQHLIGLAHQYPKDITNILNQLENIVLGECGEAKLSASLEGVPYGRRMLDEVYKRLKNVAEKRQDIIHKQEYECLIGVAGILTGECKIWWSEPFNLENIQ